MLTILGVVCLATFMIAAFTWSSQSTATKNPKEVTLGAPSVNGWNTANFFEANTIYEITMPATYNYHSETTITYYIGVVATAGQGTIETSDFTVSISGVTATLSESSAGVWTSTPITVNSPTASDDITIRIVPMTNALDLGDVSFQISAQTSA